jgi:hypothetical protein
MFLSTGIYAEENPQVTYDDSHDKYIIRLDPVSRLILTQEELEYLYHEMLGAMLHRQYGSTGVDEVVDNNALDAILRK